MIELADFHIRLIAIGAGLMLLAMIIANDVRASIKLPLVGMIVGAIFYLLNASSQMIAENPLDPLIDLVAISTPFWIWLAARRLFEREPDPRVLYGTVAVLILGWFIGNFVPWAGFTGFLILHFALLALIADVVRVGVIEREDDLVEQRRVIRLWLPALVAAQAGGILLYELYELFASFSGFDASAPIVQLLNSILIVLITLFAGLALMRTDAELLPQSEEDEPEAVSTRALDLSPSESVLHTKLNAAMQEGLYREPGLTIAALADRLDTPEHRLRALINQRLGYRNFSAFLNHHRIAEARTRLTSHDHVDSPILTIAMDLGYNSLPPFNRAFRSETGASPSEYRKRAFADAGSNPAGTATDQN